MQKLTPSAGGTAPCAERRPDADDADLTPEEARRLLEATAEDVGRDYLDAATRGLAHALDVPIAFLAEVVDPEGGRLRVVSMWWHDQHRPGFEYGIAGTPCEEVVGRRLACFPEGVAARFPADVWLAEAGIEAYLAVPLFDPTGAPAGHLGIMDHRPLARVPAKIAGLRVIARRAGAELGRLRAERELERERGRLEALVAERTLALRRSLGDLRNYGYIASHQLRAPVITISNLSGLLRSELALPGSEAHDLMGRIERAAGRLEEMIDGMEVYCALEDRDAIERPPVPMEAPLRAAAARLGARLAGAELRVGPLPALRVARSAFEILFGALLRNALDHAGGRPPVVRVDAVRREDWTFSVRDEGAGMAPDHLARVVATLEGPVADEGGVGLPLVRRIVEAHGGRVRIASAPGQGTTVSFTLPGALTA